ncbi:MAG: single-stranded DNA-binding protein [Ruminococcus sp.]|nr:single-stranded DNA-binding protein [Ruminococcus sp.]
MNKVILVGRLTADPVLRQTQTGNISCNFTVAIDQKFANKQTGARGADFIRCIAWGQTAEFVNRYFGKGKLIGVEGELRSGSYQDKNHPDVTHYTTDVFVNNVEFVGSKAESGGSGYNNNYNNNSYGNYSAPQGNYNPPPQDNYNNNYPPQNTSNNNNYFEKSAVPDNNSMSYGNVNDYEEMLSDGDLPF